jgi:hypothetical protein
MTGRDVKEIIITIMEIIPETEIELLKDLNILKDNLAFKPPELRKTGYCWIPFTNLLNNYIPEIKEEWQIKIQNILHNSEA